MTQQNKCSIVIGKVLLVLSSVFMEDHIMVKKHVLGMVMLGLLISFVTPISAQQQKPNILVIFGDDEIPDSSAHL